jgi:regulator of CtrA degradation
MTARSAIPPATTDAASGNVTPARRSLIDNFYCELLVLADDARAGLSESQTPKDPLQRIHTACESLRLTTYVLQLLQWLVELRADMAGSGAVSAPPPPPPPPDWRAEDLADIPAGLRQHIDAAVRLADRAGRLVATFDAATDLPVPHQLVQQLQKHLG